MLYQLCCYKDRDPASSGFLITPAIYWRELYLKKKPWLCTERFGPLCTLGFAQPMEHLPRWICCPEPSQPARGLHPSAVLVGDTGRAPRVLLPHPALPQEHPVHPPGAASWLWCPQQGLPTAPLAQGMFPSITHPLHAQHLHRSPEPARQGLRHQAGTPRAQGSPCQGQRAAKAVPTPAGAIPRAQSCHRCPRGRAQTPRAPQTLILHNRLLEKPSGVWRVNRAPQPPDRLGWSTPSSQHPHPAVTAPGLPGNSTRPHFQ